MSGPDPVPAYTLLAHTEWVRALARALAGDPERADDVSQDAWVVALEHAPPRLANPRAWLAAVLKNLVRQDRRAEGRRRAREEAADPAPPASSSASRSSRGRGNRIAAPRSSPGQAAHPAMSPSLDSPYPGRRRLVEERGAVPGSRHPRPSSAARSSTPWATPSRSRGSCSSVRPNRTTRRPRPSRRRTRRPGTRSGSACSSM